MDSSNKTGFPSIDKPWLKYYSEEAKNEAIPNCTLYKYLIENNKEHLDSIALNYYGTRFSYRQLFHSIDETAKAFLSIGVKPGDTVTLVTLTCIPSVLCLYALNRIGAVSNFINVLASEQEMTAYMEEASSKVVVAMDVFCEKVVKAAEVANISTVISYSLADYMPLFTRTIVSSKLKTSCNTTGTLKWKDFLGQADEELPKTSKNPAKVCYLAHTGGTTGFPKSVLLSDNDFNVIVQTYLSSMPHKRGEVFLSMMIPYVVYGTLVNIHMPLCLGLETVIIPKFEPKDWSKYIKKYHPNHCCSIPAYISPMLDDPKLKAMDLSELMTVGLGGDGLNDELEKKLNAFLASHGSSAEILAGYGMTEVCATATTAFAVAHKIGAVGIPLIHNTIMIYDNDTQKECSYNEVGEVCLHCASEMIGYKDNEKAMDALFSVHPDGTRWLHTGDLGHMDEDGLLYITGRMKRMIMTVIDGAVYKIAPSQVEQVLNQHPSVKDSCVTAAKDGTNIVLRAFIIPEEDKEEEGLRTYCAAKLADNMQPSLYVFLDEFPRTPAGKVDYRTLEEMSLDMK